MTRTIGYRPTDLLLALYRRRGPVLTVRGVPTRYVYLLGPEANRFVFANSHLFRWREAFDVLTPVDGDTALIVSDGDEHRRRRRLVQPALHHRQIDGYLRTMADAADTAIDSWHGGQVVDLYGQLRAAIRRSTVRSLFGDRLGEHAEVLGDRLQPLLDLIRLPVTVAAQRTLRTPGWRRAMAARADVDELIYAEVARARGGDVGEGDHVLATLVQARDTEGDQLTDVEIRDQVVSLIAAGYDTTSAALAWACYSLLSQPEVYERASAEVADVLGDRLPEPADLPRLTYLNGVVHETLRLYPPAVVSARKVVTEFEFAGHTVPAGSMLTFSPYVTHRLPELWPEPLRFRPERWDPAAPGYRKPGMHEFIPFSAGPHRCVGATMATTEMTVMLARLLARTTLRLRSHRPRPTGFAAMRPAGGLRAEVRDVRPRRYTSVVQ